MVGQAFDDLGGLLGEASGDTKREVFETLNEAYPAAANIQIRSMRSPQPKSGPTMQSGPRHRLYTQVNGLRMGAVEF